MKRRSRKSPPRITCACGMRVFDNFTAKMLHMYNYHPDQLVKSLPRLAEFSRQAGEYLGEQMKKGLTNGS